METKLRLLFAPFLRPLLFCKLEWRPNCEYRYYLRRPAAGAASPPWRSFSFPSTPPTMDAASCCQEATGGDCGDKGCACECRGEVATSQGTEAQGSPGAWEESVLGSVVLCGGGRRGCVSGGRRGGECLCDARCPRRGCSRWKGEGDRGGEGMGRGRRFPSLD